MFARSRQGLDDDGDGNCDVDDDKRPPCSEAGEKNNKNKCFGEIKCPTQQDETATTTEDDDGNDEEGEGR